MRGLKAVVLVCLAFADAAQSETVEAEIEEVRTEENNPDPEAEAGITTTTSPPEDEPGYDEEAPENTSLVTKEVTKLPWRPFFCGSDESAAVVRSSQGKQTPEKVLQEEEDGFHVPVVPPGASYKTVSTRTATHVGFNILQCFRSTLVH